MSEKNLDTIYHDHLNPAGLSSKNNLYKAAKTVYPIIKKRELEDYLINDDVYTLHKPSKKRYPTNIIQAASIDQIWHADLTDLSHISVYNNNTNFILFVIDVYSRFLWLKPLLNKKAKTVAEAMHDIFKKEKRIPGYICTDKGKEFLGSDFQKLLKSYGIGYFNPNSIHKASLAERVQRTIKTRMNKYFSLHNTYKYIDVLDDFSLCYNSTHHTSLNMTPNDVVNGKLPSIRVIKKNNNIRKNLLKIGDYVRVSKMKDKFEKGYEQSWTTEIFKIKDIVDHLPVIMYKLVDLKDDVISGRFYREELQRVKYDENKIFKIEKVISKYYDNKKRKKMALVKWRGWPDKFNSPVPLSELKKLL